MPKSGSLSRQTTRNRPAIRSFVMTNLPKRPPIYHTLVTRPPIPKVALTGSINMPIHTAQLLFTGMPQQPQCKSWYRAFKPFAEPYKAGRSKTVHYPPPFHSRRPSMTFWSGSSVMRSISAWFRSSARCSRTTCNNYCTPRP